LGNLRPETRKLRTSVLADSLRLFGTMQGIMTMGEAE